MTGEAVLRIKAPASILKHIIAIENLFMLEKVCPKTAYPIGASENMSLNYRLSSSQSLIGALHGMTVT